MADFTPKPQCKKFGDCWKEGACLYFCYLPPDQSDLPLFAPVGEPSKHSVDIHAVNSLLDGDRWEGLETTHFGVNGEFAHIKIKIRYIGFSDETIKCKCFIRFTFPSVEKCPVYFATGFGDSETKALRACMRAIANNEHKPDKFNSR